MSGLERVRKLEVWHDAIILARDIYELSATWPSDERYNIVSQIRRAAVSVSANLAEGVGRDTPREMVRFSRIALGSLYEVDSFLEIAAALPSLLPADGDLRQSIVTLAKPLESFIKYHEERGVGYVREDLGSEYLAEGHNQEPKTRNQELM